MRMVYTKLKKAGQKGATLVDALVGMAVFGISFFSIQAGISMGFATVKSTREELRATQIMVDKMETIRLYSWKQINTAGFIPNTFTASYFPAAAGATNSIGVTYNGTVRISAGPTGTTYSADLRTVVVSLNWNSGGRSHSRRVSTLVSQNGLQRYIY